MCKSILNVMNSQIHIYGFWICHISVITEVNLGHFSHRAGLDCTNSSLHEQAPGDGDEEKLPKRSSSSFALPVFLHSPHLSLTPLASHSHFFNPLHSPGLTAAAISPVYRPLLLLIVLFYLHARLSIIL